MRIGSVITEKNKVEILKAMLAVISSKHWDYTNHGLCYALNIVWGRRKRYRRPTLDALDIRPRTWNFYVKTSYYWKTDRRGLESRKRTLRSAIKKLQEGERKLMKR